MRNFKLIHFLLCILTFSTPGVGEAVEKEDYSGVSLEIPQKTQELIGVKTQKIGASRTLERIPVTGRISQNIENTTDILPSENGVLKKCPVAIGSMVAKGEVVCVIESGAAKLIEIRSPIQGVVLADYKNPGDKADAVSPIHTIGDLSTLYANFDIYERDLGKVKNGQRVIVSSVAYPGKDFEGKIVFVSPQVDETSLTVKVGAQIANAGLLLKPGMFLRGDIMIEDNQKHLIIPSEAVQNMSGQKIIFIQDEKESFTATEVAVKLASRRQASIEGEVKAGDAVVVGGAYVLKSKLMESEITGGCAHGH